MLKNKNDHFLKKKSLVKTKFGRFSPILLRVIFSNPEIKLFPLWFWRIWISFHKRKSRFSLLKWKKTWKSEILKIFIIDFDSKWPFFGLLVGTFKEKKRPDFCDLHFWAHMPSRSQKRVIWDFEMLIHESPIFTEISVLDVHMPLLTQIQKSVFFLKCLVHHRGHVQKKVSKSPRRHTSLIFDDFGWLIISATGRSILNDYPGTGNWWFSCTRIIVQNWSSGGRGE